jgi:ABC-type amino acid transport system permease subunit
METELSTQVQLLLATSVFSAITISGVAGVVELFKGRLFRAVLCLYPPCAFVYLILAGG